MDYMYLVDRMGFGFDSTLSRLYDVTESDRLTLAWALEDERRKTKVFAETCISIGIYDLELRTHGGFHQRYLKRFGPEFHFGMIEVVGVPNFTDILWHCGNKPKHTAGCTLLGNVPLILLSDVTDDYEFEIGQSEKAYRRVYPGVAARLRNGDRCRVRYAERQTAA